MRAPHQLIARIMLTWIVNYHLPSGLLGPIEEGWVNNRCDTSEKDNE